MKTPLRLLLLANILWLAACTDENNDSARKGNTYLNLSKKSPKIFTSSRILNDIPSNNSSLTKGRENCVRLKYVLSDWIRISGEYVIYLDCSEVCLYTTLLNNIRSIELTLNYYSHSRLCADRQI